MNSETLRKFLTAKVWLQTTRPMKEVEKLSEEQLLAIAGLEDGIGIEFRQWIESIDSLSSMAENVDSEEPENKNTETEPRRKAPTAKENPYGRMLNLADAYTVQISKAG